MNCILTLWEVVLLKIKILSKTTRRLGLGILITLCIGAIFICKVGISHINQKKEIISANSQSIYNFFDSEFKQLDNYTRSLSMTNMARKLIAMNDGSLDLDRFSLFDLRDFNQSFMAQTVSNNFINRMDVVFKSTNSVFVEGNSIVSYQQYLNLNFDEDQAEVLSEAIDSLSGTPCILQNTISSEFLYIVNMTPSANNDKKACIVFYIDPDNLDQSLQQHTQMLSKNIGVEIKFNITGQTDALEWIPVYQNI